MQAQVYDAYGGPEVLRVEEVPTADPVADEVLVKVRAASINEWDQGLLHGTPFVNRIGGIRTPKHRTIGSDIAGTVDRVGPAVTRFRPGDDVMGDLSACGFGAFAQYAVAPESALTAKPGFLTWEQAAAVPQAGTLAVAGLRKGRPFRRGHRVLVNGGGGGVGTFAIQIAKAFGAEVTGVDSAAKGELMRAVGADHVIDFADRDYAREGLRYDLILDVFARRSVPEYLRALRPSGTAALVGGSSHLLVSALLVGPPARVATGRTVSLVMWRPNNPLDVALLLRLVEQGAVTPVVDRTFPLTALPDAMRYYATGKHQGKIVITM